jgi:periplasmic protein TonB
MITTRQKMTRYGISLAVVLGVHAVAIILALQWSNPRAIELPPAGDDDRSGATASTASSCAAESGDPTTTAGTGGRVADPQAGRSAQAEDFRSQTGQAQAEAAAAQACGKKQEPVKEKPSEEKPSDAKRLPRRQARSQRPGKGRRRQQLAAKASWEGTLLAHLGKYKKYPPAAQSRGKEGLNRLRFVVDAEGKVLSYELVGRSGNADLDRATLEMIRRAQPLPKPPADMLTNGSIEIVAPFVYSSISVGANIRKGTARCPFCVCKRKKTAQALISDCSSSPMSDNVRLSIAAVMLWPATTWTPAMTLTELRYIVTLAQEQHFGHAAERCHVSQPTLSVGVKKLEDELGVLIFERSKSAVRLTPGG